MTEVADSLLHSPPVPPEVTLADIRAARERIASRLPATPLAHSSWFSRRWGCDVWFKFENLQMTGSFKERGALNRLLQIGEEERSKGVITASAGNHGQAVASHARQLGIPATVVMPVNTPLIKVSNTSASGARVILQGGSFDEAADHARQLCEREGLSYVHGFDDPAVIAGQGTLGLELLEQCPDLDTVVVPVGGAGLISGVGLAIKQLRPPARVIGVQYEGVPSLKEALAHGAPVTVPPHRTIAEGIAVRRVGELPFRISSCVMDELVTVAEDEIANAILLLLEREKTVAEGAGAVGVAAIENGHLDVARRRVVVILTGGNIDVNVLSRIIERGLVKGGRLARVRVTVPDLPGHLARVLEVIAAERANLLEVSHSRAFSDVPVGETAIDLVLETRSPEHIEELHAALCAKGIRVEQDRA